MEKNKKDNIIKRWNLLVSPHKGYFVGQIFFYCVYTVFLSVITIFAARTINYMYQQNWKMAFTYLMLELLTIILRNIAMHIQYIYYTKHVRHIRVNVANKLYDKILSCNKLDLQQITKEKVVNIALNNMSNLSEFPDAVASFVAYSLQVIFILVTVFVSNYWAGIIVTLLGVVNFFAYFKFNKRLGYYMLKRNEQKDALHKSYSKVIEGKKVITELNGTVEYRNEIVKGTEDYADYYKKYYMLKSWKDNLYWASWNVVVYGITALMLYFVSKGTLDMTVYLVIVPYLSSCTDSLCDLFDKTGSLENMRVDVDRVNLILNLNDEELVEYGNINMQCEGYNLGFIDVSSECHSDNSTLKNADISFKMRGVNVIKGESGSGKRAIFDLLRRYSRPTNGMVLLDNLDLYDYNEKTFKNHIDYCASHPEFISGTIAENLKIVDKNMKNIELVCEKVGVLEEIHNLPKGFETDISEISNTGLRFLIGLVRAILSNSNILMVYEIPQDTDEKFRQHIVNLVKSYDLNKTVILFTHSNDYDEIADCVYEVKNGKVSYVNFK